MSGRESAAQAHQLVKIVRSEFEEQVTAQQTAGVAVTEGQDAMIMQHVSTAE